MSYDTVDPAIDEEKLSRPEGSRRSRTSQFAFSQLPLGSEPELHIAPLGTTPLYPELVSTLTNELAFFQLSGRHIGLVGEFVQGFNRPVVGDLPLQPPIARGPLPKLAYF